MGVSPKPRPASPWTPGLRAIRRFYRPMLLFQAAAAALVAAYAVSPGFRAACETLAAWKDQGGLLLAALATAVAGAILPELAKSLTGVARGWPRQRLRDMRFNTLFFAFNGVLVDLFYRGQGMLLGTGRDAATTTAKMLVDMLLFTPLIAVPIVITVYTWRADRYDGRRTLARWSPDFYRERALPLLLPNWAYWTPMVLCIYSLPATLQFWLFLLALAAWSMIMVFLAAPEPRTEAEGAWPSAPAEAAR